MTIIDQVLYHTQYLRYLIQKIEAAKDPATFRIAVLDAFSALTELHKLSDKWQDEIAGDEAGRD